MDGDMSPRKAAQMWRGREGRERKRREFLELIASIPRDTRDITGRLMGDPLPGRGALAEKNRGEVK